MVCGEVWGSEGEWKVEDDSLDVVNCSRNVKSIREGCERDSKPELLFNRKPDLSSNSHLLLLSKWRSSPSSPL